MALDVNVGVNNLEEAAKLYTHFQNREKVLLGELDSLLEEQTQLDIKMSSFQHMRPTLKALSKNAQDLFVSISKASHLAESVSRKVRLLDVAKGHVYAAMKQVDDVIDLKSCVEEVQRYMQREDYEKAAVQVHHYLSLDQTLLREVMPGQEQASTSNSFQQLEQYEKELSEVIERKFTEALSKEDINTADKYFKLFPSIHLHQKGLDKFCEFLKSQVRSRGDDRCSPAIVSRGGERAGVVFADILTLVFEDVAATLDKYCPIVKSCYGNSYLQPFVTQLQLVCDSLVEKCLKMHREERCLDSKVSTVGMALKAKAAVGAIRPDVLELDLLLTECSMCSSSSELYFRFLQRLLAGTDGSEPSSHGDGDYSNQLLSECGARQALQVLISKYIVLENYFMSESLLKAMRMDHWSTGSLTSSMADDIFFVLQKCIKRAVASANVDCTCAMMNHARILLEDDYRTVLSSRIQASLPASTAGLDLSSILQGRLPARSTGNSDIETNKFSCMVALNDVEVSIENIHKLTKDMEMECAKLVAQVGGSSRNKIQSCLSELSSSSAKLKTLRQEGISKLLEKVIMPRLLPALEVFNTLEHVLTEEKLTSYEVDDPFVHQLVKVLQTTLEGVKAEALDQVYEQVAMDTMSEVAVRLEDLLLKSSYNQLGGMQLDRDVRALVGYLTSLTAWPIRDKFARLSEMATLLSLEKLGEVVDYWGDASGGGGLVWRLTSLEVRKILKLRNDFGAEDVDRLRL